jgi:hypothetical protein
VYSVLTRVPPPERLGGAEVRELLDGWFSGRWLELSASAARLALGRLEQLGVRGGATYDGVIGLTAAASGATLLTLDRRALPTYERLGATVELVA